MPARLPSPPPRGALLASGDGPALAIPTTAVTTGDACGAGDRFAATIARLLADGALPSQAVTAAVAAATAHVTGGALGTSGPTAVDGTDPMELARRVRAQGGTVVATGGCFDLLHVGHVSMLASARALGDCLIVCLNSDASVRRLKGAGRPLQPASDRARILAALGCVDAVAVFDEDTPVEVLDLIRPHVFAKGADYSVEELPEARAVAAWGGEAVVLPYLAGCSTTDLMKGATRVTA